MYTTSEYRKVAIFVNLEKHPNTHREERESIERVLEINKFVQRIKLKISWERQWVMKRKADERQGTAIEYKEGDLMYVDSSNINSD